MRPWQSSAKISSRHPKPLSWHNSFILVLNNTFSPPQVITLTAELLNATLNAGDDGGEDMDDELENILAFKAYEVRTLWMISCFCLF